MPTATLRELVEATKEQLQLYQLCADNLGMKPEPIYIIFAVGINDLAPNAYLLDIVQKLNSLVHYETLVRNQLGSCVCNISFSTIWPPSMERIGAGAISFHAQQLVEIVFRFYNKWVSILNGHNRAGIFRLCKPFNCDRGKYILKLSQIEENGIMPTLVTAKTMERNLDKSIAKVRDDWLKPNEYQDNQCEGMLTLLTDTWKAVLESEKLYIDAYTGADVEKRKVQVAYYSITHEDVADRNAYLKKEVLFSRRKRPKRKADQIEQSESDSVEPPGQDRNDICDQNLQDIEEYESCEQRAPSKVEQITLAEMEQLQCSDAEQTRTYKLCEAVAKLALSRCLPEAERQLRMLKVDEEAVAARRLEEDKKRLINFQNRLKIIEESTPAPIVVERIGYKDPFTQTYFSGKYNPMDPYAVPPDDDDGRAVELSSPVEPRSFKKIVPLLDLPQRCPPKLLESPPKIVSLLDLPLQPPSSGFKMDKQPVVESTANWTFRRKS